MAVLFLVYRGPCLAGFQLFADVCLTFSTNICAKPTYEKVGIDNFADLVDHSVDISMIDSACDPKGKYKDKKMGIAQIESLKELEDLMKIYTLSEFAQCTNDGYFVKVYNNATCQYEPAVLQKINGSFHIEKADRTSSKKYDFICKYTLQPETSKLKKREKEASGKRKNSSPSQLQATGPWAIPLILAIHWLARALSN